MKFTNYKTKYMSMYIIEKEKLLTELKIIGLTDIEINLVKDMNVQQLENIKALLLSGLKFESISMYELNKGVIK